jgi:translation initiation factor IF-1
MHHTAHAREHLVELAGVIVSRERKGLFKVEIADTGRVINTRLSGRMQRHHINLVRGDWVTIELPVGTLDRARIIYRRSA